MSNLFPALGAAVALAGGDKLAGMRGYDGMFDHLGWSREDMRLAAIAELAGGILMMPRFTRPLGGALVATASAAVLTSELMNGETKLAMPRGLVLFGALCAVAASVLLPKTAR
jgi:uncharacterized membrane protein YphA (DoxX/SURF4 family)